MRIRLVMGQRRTSTVRHQLLLSENRRLLVLSPRNIEATQELPDRGRDNNKKSVSDPHSKTVQE
jgi:hypothetical protein